LSSPLSIFSTNYINIGKKEAKTKIISLTHDRSYIHVFSGKIKCYLFHPIQKDKLYLKKHNNSRYTSEIDTQNPDYKKFPKYKSTEYVEIILRENNILFIPTFWSFYIEHIEDTVSLFYTSDTLISKVINIFV